MVCRPFGEPPWASVRLGTEIVGIIALNRGQHCRIVGRSAPASSRLGGARWWKRLRTRDCDAWRHPCI
jgi:hypothetical protein